MADVLYLWLVERIAGASVNEYQGFVVAACTGHEAYCTTWDSWGLNRDEVEVKRIGVAEPGIEAGEFILCDYNGG